MHPACGNKKVIENSLNDLNTRFVASPDEIRAHLAQAVGQANVEATMARVSGHLVAATKGVQTEQSLDDHEYVSRIDSVGRFQSILATVFQDVPGLQGYGDKNPIWLTTLVESAAHNVKSFFDRTRHDVVGGQPLWAALISELAKLPADGYLAPFPPGTPPTIQMPDDVKIALLADWGGDNPAARRVADVVRKQSPQIAIHLGDVYYGGTESECNTFLNLWPMPKPWKGSSYALNGNHEMYCGGQYYFQVILGAFQQPQSFFCLENKYWRLIGLDSAYNKGTLKPRSADDPVTAQWNWLIDLLKIKDAKANILLTHHQPVSAHRPEWLASEVLRAEVNEILNMEGVGKDSIFGWFFGHEHRCAVYDDAATSFNARLIGNGCIPHLVQTEKDSDEGCTPFKYCNRKPIAGDPNAAVSSFAKLHFEGYEVQIDYLDEDFCTLGAETWSQKTGRSDPRFPFQEYDAQQGESERSPAGV